MIEISADVALMELAKQLAPPGLVLLLLPALLFVSAFWDIVKDFDVINSPLKQLTSQVSYYVTADVPPLSVFG
jgi:hypothetical protein